jgi:large subunit ribosomal protein L35
VGWNPTWFTPSIFLNYLKGLKMPKIKTNRAAAKRFKKTGTGKFVFSKSHASHILTKKTTKRKRRLRQSQIIDKTNRKSIKLLLPNG